MRLPPLLAALPILLGMTGPGTSYRAQGALPPWKLRIEANAIRLDRAQYPGQKPDHGRIDRVERMPGRVRIAAMIEIYEIHPLGGKARDGNPMVLVESSEEPLSIEITEGACNAGGHSFPTQVLITGHDGQQLRGCGETLAALAGLIAK